MNPEQSRLAQIFEDLKTLVTVTERSETSSLKMELFSDGSGDLTVVDVKKESREEYVVAYETFTDAGSFIRAFGAILAPIED